MTGWRRLVRVVPLAWNHLGTDATGEAPGADRSNPALIAPPAGRDGPPQRLLRVVPLAWNHLETDATGEAPGADR